MRPARRFHDALAIGAPVPHRSVPAQLERMIHFIPPHNQRILARLPELLARVDVLLGNLEDAVPVEEKVAARQALVELGRSGRLGNTPFWARVNTLDSPWGLDDLLAIGAAGDVVDVVMLPKVNGPWDIHFADQLLAQLEAKHGVRRPILLHAILETAEGIGQLEAIAACSPRLHGMSIGPADLAASRGMKTTRVGGGHPDYRVLADADADAEGRSPRPSFQQDLWHYTLARMIDACAANGLKAFYGPFGDFSDPAACEVQFRNAFIMGCAGAWTLHPSQIDIARRVFTPDEGEVSMARRILAALPDGSGAVMIDGRMQDDATWKQAKVLVDLADAIAARGVLT
ncbi:HpcH/HpaI aldolase/citrate lyase family protein [Roseomonas sp. WA12]